MPSFALLAPLAGYSDLSFRRIATYFGAGLTTTEMINANALLHEDKSTLALLKPQGKNGREAVQIFGHEPDVISEVISKVINPIEEFSFVDINFGCPAPKIVKNGDGCALMRNPYLAAKIAEKAVKVSNKPISCKMRLGFCAEEENFLTLGKMFEEVGVSAITLHARTREQFYSGFADWTKIKALVDEVSIPVIGNGDIRNSEDAFRMVDETNCKGVAIGRSAIGNPWIFSDILKTANDLERVEISKDELYKTIYFHYENMKIEKGERMAVLEMRKQFPKYLRGIPGAAKMRSEVIRLTDYDDVLSRIKTFIRGTI